MDQFAIPRAFLHYNIVSCRYPGHNDTDMVIDIEHRTIYLNLDAAPDANVVRAVFPSESHRFTPDESPRKRHFLHNALKFDENDEKRRV